LRSGTIEEKNPFRVVSTKGLGCLEWLYLKLTTSKLGIRFSSDTCVRECDVCETVDDQRKREREREREKTETTHVLKIRSPTVECLHAFKRRRSCLCQDCLFL